MSTNELRALVDGVVRTDADALAVVDRAALLLRSLRHENVELLEAARAHLADRLDSLAGENERLRAEMNALVIGHVAENCREKLEAAMARLPDDEWRAICAMFAECERVTEGQESRADAAEAELARVRADSERLDYIQRTFSGMTNRERYLPVQMIWGKGCNGRTLREACDKYMARDATLTAETTR